VLAGVRPGVIVLLHDGGGDRSATVAALPAIIDGLRRLGLSLALVPG
jgi:peptidoglycan-N-acetylglucosamine deacetylase